MAKYPCGERAGELSVQKEKGGGAVKRIFCVRHSGTGESVVEPFHTR